MTSDKAGIKYILVVDDEDDVRELITQHLLGSINDIKIIEARDGSEAISKLSYQAFDCIITDLQMPRKDGIDLLKKIKTSNLNSSTPILVVTGFPDEQILERFSNITFIEKPYDKKILTQLVESQLKLGKMNQRVTANVLNVVIEASESLISQLIKEEANSESPMAKSAQDSLKGDIFAVLEYKQSQVVSKICFGFDKTLAAHIIKSFKDNEVSPGSNPLDIFISNVFKSVLSKMAQEKQNFTLSKKLFFNGTEDFNYKELNSLKAIVMPIKTTHGYLYIQAMHLENTRKTNSAA